MRRILRRSSCCAAEQCAWWWRLRCQASALVVPLAKLHLHATPVWRAEELRSTKEPPVVVESHARPVEAATGTEAAEGVHITDEENRPVSVTPLHRFDELHGMNEWLATGIEQLGFTTTMGIQKYTIPLLDQGHDLIGLAPTGSGKTVAFAVPALKRFEPQRDGAPSILVLAPTRELVQQTTHVFENLSCRQVRIAEAYGGAPREAQARRLHNGCDVLVACPGRLKDFLDAGDVTLAGVRFFVFDEADRLLDMGFHSQLTDIIARLSPTARVQKMMWSATWPPAVRQLARDYLHPKRILIRVDTAGTGLQVNNHIKQNVFVVNEPRERVEQLARLIESGRIDENVAKLIIFVERQSDTEDAAHALSRRLGIDARYIGSIHGGLPQRQRDMVMQRFKSNQIRLLVATDVASRGLDIPDVTCVVNFQAPKNIDVYCHRIGRTGRAGRQGEAFTFLSFKDGALAADLVKYLQHCNTEVPAELADLAARHTADQRRWSKPRRHGSRTGGGAARGEESMWADSFDDAK